jgi:hypothetical protein
MAKIKVYPTHENAGAIRHPVDGPLNDDGSMWEEDGFTGRMLADNAVTTDPERGHKYEAPRPDHTRPPAHATGSGVPKVEEKKAEDKKPEEKPPEKYEDLKPVAKNSK